MKLTFTLFIIISCFHTYTSKANNSSVDSLKILLEEESSIENRANINYQLARNYLVSSVDSAIYFTFISLELSKQIQNKNIQAKGNFMLGYLYDLKDDVKKATRYYLEASYYYSQIKDYETEQDLYQNILTIALENEVYGVTHFYNNKRLELINEISDYKTRTDIHFDKGKTEMKNEAFIHALNAFLKAKLELDQYGSTDDHVLYADILNSIGFIFIKLNEEFFTEDTYLDSSLYYFDKSLAMTNSELNNSRVLNNKGLAHSLKLDYTKAFELYHKSLTVSAKVDIDLLKIPTYNNLGILHFKTGNFDSAYYYFSEIVNFNLIKKSISTNRRDKSLSIDFYTIDEMESSLLYMDSISAIRTDLTFIDKQSIDNFFVQHKARVTDLKQINGEFIMEETLASLAKKEKEIKEKAEAKNTIYLLGGIGGIVLTILLFLLRRFKIIKQREKIVRELSNKYRDNYNMDI